jgi:hypothetical protein
MLSMARCKIILGVIWMAFFLGLFTLLLLQVDGSKYGGDAGTVWSWFLPMILPTVTLIVGVFLLDVQNNSIQEAKVNFIVFFLAVSGSIIYLIFLSWIFLGEPFSSKNVFSAMKDYGMPISVLQGLVNSLIGVFFMNKK